MPLVLGEGHAHDLASRILASASEPDAALVALGPQWLDVEPGDALTDEAGQTWRVEDVSERGLQRTLDLRPSRGAGLERPYVDPEGQPVTASHPSEPYLVVLDAPALSGATAGKALIGVTAEPWTGPVRVHAGPDAATSTLRAVAETPATLGQLKGDLSPGPLGRWDEASVLDVYMPGADLASRTGRAVLNGGGQLLVQSASGWECLAYRDAILIDEDRWQLRGLLRGLAGSQISTALSGALVVLIDEALVDVELAPEEAGLSLEWTANEADPISFVYENRAGLAWSVGHLRALASGTGWALSWTRRGPDIPASWALPEAANDGRFRVETFLNGQLVETMDMDGAGANIGGAADSLRVGEIGPDGRVGHWSSIPLSSP
jgi:hypothetical protein